MKIRLTAIAHILATGFYSGYSPVMPGTCGTLAAAAVAALVLILSGSDAQCAQAIFIASAFAWTGIGIWAMKNCLEHDSRFTGREDPQSFVVDEWAGYFVALAMLPPLWESLIYAFFLFRLFDMTKPPPIRQLERLPGAFGIMFDDIAAGIFAGALGLLIV